jgi:hypothetical protein
MPDEGERMSEGSRKLVAIAPGALAVLGIALAATDPGQRLVVNALIQIPLLLAGEVEQTFGFATARDGTRIAYATTGEGPAVIQVLPRFTHLELGVDSPAYNPSAAHPERVNHLILVASLAGKGGANPVWNSIGDMMRSGARDSVSPASQQMLASIIIPDAVPDSWSSSP